METQTAKLYQKTKNGVKMDRGVAFPVCISVNDVVCNHSPLKSEELVRVQVAMAVILLSCISHSHYSYSFIQEPLKEGDVVKMDLGCHLDGYIAVAAHTVVVGGEEGYKNRALPNRAALGNVAVAAYNAMLVASQQIHSGPYQRTMSPRLFNVLPRPTALRPFRLYVCTK